MPDSWIFVDPWEPLPQDWSYSCNGREHRVRYSHRRAWLMPEEAFSDRLAEPRSLSRTVAEGVFISRTAGYVREHRPTFDDFVAATRTDCPSDRERFAWIVWLQEASDDQVLAGVAEGLYSARSLIRAIHTIFPRSAYDEEFIAMLNRQCLLDWVDQIPLYEPLCPRP